MQLESVRLVFFFSHSLWLTFKWCNRLFRDAKQNWTILRKFWGFGAGFEAISLAVSLLSPFRSHLLEISKIESNFHHLATTEITLPWTFHVFFSENDIGFWLHGCFQKSWYPQIIHFNRVFHYKPSILGYHHFRKSPDVGSTYLNHHLLGVEGRLLSHCSTQQPLHRFQYLLMDDQHQALGPRTTSRLVG